MAKFKIIERDVFTIPLNDKEVGFGQVVAPYDKTSGGFMVAFVALHCAYLGGFEKLFSFK